MKKTISILTILFITLLGVNTNISSAQSVADVFKSETPVTWLGVDYSDMRFIGPLDVSSSQLDDYAKVLNDLYVRETKKYNLASAFDKQTITNNLSYVEKANAAMNTDKITSSDSKDMTRYTAETISKIVKAYNIKESGIGLVYITEALSKNEQEGAYWVTFIDMKNGSVLMTERVKGKAGGFGFRNYWAGSFYSSLKQIKGSSYKEWRKKYAK
jgi:hypothetical protein